MAYQSDDDTAPVVLIYTTFPDADTAKRIASALLGERLIACANLFPGMIAVFRWEGKTDAEGEVAGILKTTPDRVEAVRRALHAAHPYDVPAFIALPESAASAAFGNWVHEETRPET